MKKDNQDLFNIQKYIKYAIGFTRNQEDSEDCIQQAFLTYLKYKDSLDTSNPEKTIMWLIKQECIRLDKKKTLQSSGKILKFEDMYTYLPSEDRQDFIDKRTNRITYNEGPLNYDLRVFEKLDKKLTKSIKSTNRTTVRKEKNRVRNLYLGNIESSYQKVCNISIDTRKEIYLSKNKSTATVSYYDSINVNRKHIKTIRNNTPNKKIKI